MRSTMGNRGRPRHPDILTPREWEVMALLREGRSNDEIATTLGVTVATARFHVSEILSKLAVANRHEAAAWRPEGARREWALAFAPLVVARRMNWEMPTVAVGALVTTGAVVLVVVLAWGVGQTSRAPAESRDGSHVCTPGPTVTPYPKTRIPPTLAPADRPPPVSTESILTEVVGWSERFVASGCDVRALPTAGVGTIDFAYHPQTVGEAVARADFIVTGHVTATVFKGDFQSTLNQEAYETIVVDRTLKGDVSGTVTIQQDGGPNPGNGGLLLSAPADQVLLPGDDVLLLGIRTGPGLYRSQYPVGKYFIRSTKVYAVEGNPCNTVDGQSVAAVATSIVASVLSGASDHFLTDACDWSRYPQ